MPSTTAIPSALLPIGARTYGPVNLGAADSDLQVNLDRTPTNGLNARPATSSVTAVFELLLPGDPTWYEVGRAKFVGGSRIDQDSGLPLATDYLGVSLWSPGLSGRQIRVTVTVAGTTVRVSGSIVIT